MITTSHKKAALPSARRLAIVGAGVLGTSLAIVLSRLGYTIAGIADCRETAAGRASDLVGGALYSTDLAHVARQADLILITTSDDAITQACQTIAAGGGIGNGDVVLHCSGMVSSEALVSARSHGASVASMHPLGVFADIETATSQLSGIFYSLEGETRAVAVAEGIVSILGGYLLPVTPEQKMHLHIAACLSANYTTTLMDMAAGLLEHVNISGQDALRILTPLLSGTVRILQKRGLPGALTGPIARGDAATIRRHLEVMSRDEETTRIYALLGLRTIPIAQAKGVLDDERLQEIKEILSEKAATANRRGATSEKGVTRS